ncbi:hypothetical protein C4J81_07560 [Deltaproteobacteria bacterium Smac51]|nr:hypothetical protein C4J81_07560 [Deltaproteobacteria bacterium Smac51]
MGKKDAGDKIWRGTALVILCGLVYYFSYDHGRDAINKDLASLRQEAAQELEVQRREIMRLRSALAECAQEKMTASAAAAPVSSPVETTPPPPVERLVLRSGQSKIIFDGELVVTLLQVAGTENRALIQLNFLEEERLVTENIGSGGSMKFTLDNRNWALVASSMSISSATLNLVELKKNNE